MNKNLITIHDYNKSDYEKLFKKAEKYLKNPISNSLKGKSLINLFFENSTRTRCSFEIAAKNMGAEVINIDVSTSSVKKGETEFDTITTLNMMYPSFMTIRHNVSGYISRMAEYTKASVINSGDGSHEHPTQALLDCFTIQRYKNLKGLKVAICGDIANSRVARSNIHLLKMFGAKIRLVAPLPLLPTYLDDENVTLHTNMEQAIKDVDVIMTLRIQKERMKGTLLASDREYHKFYGVNSNKIKYAKKDVIVLHPGPMNRGVEISTAVADNEKICKVLEQVQNGIAIRQAVLNFLF